MEDRTRFEDHVAEQQKKETADISPEGMIKQGMKNLETVISGQLAALETYRQSQQEETRNLAPRQKADDQSSLVNETYTKLIGLRSDLGRLQDERLSEEQKETILEQRIKGLETSLQDWKRTRDQIPANARERRNAVGDYMNDAYNDMLNLRLALAEKRAKQVATQAETQPERKTLAA